MDLDEHLQRIEDLMWPNLMILGGGVSKNADKFLPRLSRRTPVVAATLRNDAGIIGAAIVAAEGLADASTTFDDLPGATAAAPGSDAGPVDRHGRSPRWSRPRRPSPGWPPTDPARTHASARRSRRVSALPDTMSPSPTARTRSIVGFGSYSRSPRTIARA